MSFINWGSESQEQRDSRRRFEEEIMLIEQAIRFAQAQQAMAQTAAQAAAQSGAIGSVGAVGGVGGVGGGGQDASVNKYVEKGYIDNYFE